ncbi:hypothetical protein Mgra_00007375, partial [Meloidogyne graminicola]
KKFNFFFLTLAVPKMATASDEIDQLKNEKEEEKINKKEEENKIKDKEINDSSEESEIPCSKRGDFYVSTTELETEDTDNDIKIIKKQIENTPLALSKSNTAENDLTFSMSQIIGSKEAKKVTFTKRQQNSGMGRSISEILRAKLAELPVREEGNFTL